MLQSKHNTITAEYDCLDQVLHNNGECNNQLGDYVLSNKTNAMIDRIKELHLNLQLHKDNDLNGINAKKLLENMLIEKETQLIEINNLYSILQNQLSNKDNEMYQLTSLLKELEKDTEMQLVLVAKLTTSNEQWESKHANWILEKDELVSRCNTLRNMNNELMQMLESN